MSKPLKFCKDCAFCWWPWAERPRCDKAEQYNLVTGKKSLMYCTNARLHSGPCGPDAKLFELKQESGA